MDSVKDLRLLNQNLQDAFHREKFLEYKLNALQRITEKTHRSSELGWRAFIDEDRLITRCAVLNKQLEIYQSKYTDEQFQEEMQTLRMEKVQFQENVKQLICKVNEEKLYAVRRIYELEMSLRTIATEYIHLKERRESSQEEISDLSRKYNKQFKKAEDLQHKIMETENCQRESCRILVQENKNIALLVERQSQIVQELQRRVDILEQLKIETSHFNICCTNPTFCEVGTNTQIEYPIIHVRSEEDIIPTKLQRESRGEAQLTRNQFLESEDIQEFLRRVEELNICLKEPWEQEFSSSAEMSHKLEERLHALEKRLSKLKERSYGTSRVETADDTFPLKNEIAKLEELIAEVTEENKVAEQHSLALMHNVEQVKSQFAESLEEGITLETKLCVIQDLLEKKKRQVAELEEKIQLLAESNSNQMFCLQDAEEKLKEESGRADTVSTIVTNLQQQLNESQESLKDSLMEAACLREKVIQHERAKEYTKKLTEVDKLKRQCTSLQEETAQLRLEHWELLQQSSELSRIKTVERNDKTSRFKAPTAAEVCDVREKCENAQRNLSALELELNEAKARYKICVDEKDHVLSELHSLRDKYERARKMYSVPIKYVVPMLIAFVVLLVCLP